MEKYSEVTCTNFDTFRLSFNEDWFKKDEIITMTPSGFTVRVKKVYKFTLWKRFLCWLGHDFKVMDLEEINKDI